MLCMRSKGSFMLERKRKRFWGTLNTTFAKNDPLQTVPFKFRLVFYVTTDSEISYIQECIPVGCVPTAAVAISGRGGGGVWCGVGWCGGCLVRGRPPHEGVQEGDPPPPPVNRQMPVKILPSPILRNKVTMNKSHLWVWDYSFRSWAPTPGRSQTTRSSSPTAAPARSPRSPRTGSSPVSCFAGR